MMRSNDERKPTAKRIEIISLRMVREKTSMLYPNRVIRSPLDAVDLFRQFIGDYDREAFCILCLNTKTSQQRYIRYPAGR